MIVITGAIAELERTLIIERVRAGMRRLRDILANVVKVAPTDSTVLILAIPG